ncbi:MAG TPA: hypothetical protein VEY09_05910 [Pyrinomonadaceae bacterium]|nr:hypothetical protein [Pyrinomonadaceae bacterium]
MRVALLFVVVGLACGAGAAAGAGAGAEMAGGESQVLVPLRSGAFVAFSTETESGTKQEVPSSFVESEGEPNVVRRIFLDGRGELFFGYELSVEPAPAGGAGGARQFRVSVRPLGEEFLRQLSARPSFAGRRLHPRYNPAAFDSRPQLIGDGDTFALDVLRNTRNGAKIVDLVTVTSEDPRRRALPVRTSPPRDFNAEEVRLQVTGYTLSVNGEVVHRSRGGCSGPLVWFSLPGRGRFVVSLVPRPGYDFRQAGSIEHDRIRFEFEGDSFEWASAGPVVATGGNWNVWVLHDPNFDFDLSDPPASAAPGEDFEKRLRQATRPRDRAEFGRAEPGGGRTSRRRVRVVVGSAENIEWLLPRPPAAAPAPAPAAKPAAKPANKSTP